MSEILSISVTLFLIMDPFGNIPIFLPILERVPKERRRLVLVRELLFALAIIAVFTLAGKYVMQFLGLEQASVSIAGGIILFLIAIRMVFPRHDLDNQPEFEGEPFLVPMAVPLVSGPSLLAALLLFSSTGTLKTTELLLAAVGAWVVSFAVLYLSTYIVDFLTKRGLAAVERLMGMILVAVAVQLFLDGMASYLE
ncbi:MAG: NAAT family transporter [candidate division Zixibacteria bacterium]|nr:NAAT family transporter [candidate division Zixibacteria bacterium]